jgi:ABC-type transporter Mla subunit MlaD
MEDRDKKTELLVGLFLTVGLLMMGVLVLQFGSVKDYFKRSYNLRVSFPDAAGIKDGSPVVLGGARIGKVLNTPKLNSTFTGVIIDLEVSEGVQIPKDAVFQIKTAGLMGDSLIDIKPTGDITNDFLVPDPNVLIEGKTSGMGDLQKTADDIGKKADVVLDDARGALKEIKESMAKINTGALSDATINDFKKSIEHLSSTMKRVDEKVLGEENTANLTAALADIKVAAAGFKTSATNLSTASAKLGPTIDKLDPVIAKFDKVVTTADEALVAIKKGAESFGFAGKKLNTGDGLLQALMSDAQLKDDFKTLIANMRRNGVVFYKDNAEKKQAEEDAKKKPSVSPFRR